MKLSILTTMYMSANFLEQFILEINSNVQKLEIIDYEIILVNDGSPDNSLEVSKSLQKNNSHIKIIDLSRNFGHHHAIQAGLTECNGDHVFLIDCDLETSPSVLIDMYSKITLNSETDVVYGFQETRKGKYFERISGDIFYNLLNKLSDTTIPKNILTERIMTKKYVQALLSLGDANLFLGGMMYWVGYNQEGISIKKNSRPGSSTYTTRKKINLLINAISAFSGKPLTWLFNFGIIISTFSFISGLALAFVKIFYQDNIQVGWTSLILINMMILGIISTFLGIIGIYLHKIFKQVQNRPNFIIKNIYK